MTLRFASAQGAFTLPRLADAQLHALSAVPANDNVLAKGSDDALLDAALRHFARHGMAAAQRARKQSETAFFEGDRPAYRWWLEICRILDRRMARELIATTDGMA